MSSLSLKEYEHVDPPMTVSLVDVWEEFLALAVAWEEFLVLQ